MGDVGFVGGAQLVFGDLDAGGEALGGDARIGDAAGLGAGVAVGMRGVLGFEIGLGRGRHRLGQEARVEPDPVEAALLAKEVEHGQGGGIGHGCGGLDAGADEAARGFAPHLLLEFRRREPGALEHEGIGVAVELAVWAAEGRGGDHLLAHGLVAHREPEPRRLRVEGGVVDEAAEHHAVDAVLPRLAHGKVAAELRGDRAQFLIQRAAVLLGGD